jgi:hypothetical protein
LPRIGAWQVLNGFEYLPVEGLLNRDVAAWFRSDSGDYHHDKWGVMREDINTKNSLGFTAVFVAGKPPVR